MTTVIPSYHIWWLWIHGGCGNREDQSRLELWDVLRVEKLTDRAELRRELSIPRSPITLSHRPFKNMYLTLKGTLSSRVLNISSSEGGLMPRDHLEPQSCCSPRLPQAEQGC